MAEGNILGIDIGTTSIKTSIINASDLREVACYSVSIAEADVASRAFGVQNVQYIIAALEKCVSFLDRSALASVTKIGVCGQMHGVMCWNSEDIENCRGNFARVNTSELFNWQNRMCSQIFLAGLPLPDSHMSINSGYGCCTLFWLRRNDPDKLAKYSCSGTIHDFLIALLCKKAMPCMSPQNAATWGYFNTEQECWNSKILSDAGFPVNLLPTIVKSSGNQVAGLLSSDWHGITAGASVYVAYGDVQCSVLSTMEPHDAVLNIGTSAQLTFLAPRWPLSELRSALQAGPAIEFFPYFGGRYLAMAASLNGGNVLDGFVSTFQKWLADLGINMSKDEIWRKVLSAEGRADHDPQELSQEQSPKSTLKIVPTLFGERHSPDLVASVLNIGPSSTGSSLPGVMRALCSGLIENLITMMPTELMVNRGSIKRIVCCGSAITRNNVLKEEAVRLFTASKDSGLPSGSEEETVSLLGGVVFREASAARGAAVATCL